MKPTGAGGLTSPNTPIKFKPDAKLKTLDLKKRPYQGRQLSKVPDTAKKLPSGSDSESGYESAESPTASTPAKKPIKKALIAVKYDLPPPPVDLKECTLDTAHPLYATPGVELIPVKDSEGKDTGLLFKTYPKEMDADDKEGKKAWAMKSLTNEAYVFNHVASSPKLVQCYGMHTMDGRQGVLVEKIKGPTLDQKFKELRTLYEVGHLTLMQYKIANKALLRQAAECLQCLHKDGFMHADFRPENLIFDTEKQHLRVIDMGMATHIGEMARPGHEWFVDPEGVSFKVEDHRRFREFPPEGRQSLLDLPKHIRRNLPKGAYTDTKMDIYGLGQMAHIQGFSKGDSLELFTMGAEVDTSRTKTEMGIYKAFNDKQQYYLKNSVLSLEPNSTDFKKTELTKVMEKMRRAKEMGVDYVEFMNCTLAPHRQRRSNIKEVLAMPFLNQNFMEKMIANGIIQNSTRKYESLKKRDWEADWQTALEKSQEPT